MKAEAEISQIERDQMVLINEQLAAEEEALLAELRGLEQEGEALHRRHEDALDMIVNSPERVSEEREVAGEELKLILEQHEMRLNSLQAHKLVLSTKEEALNSVHLAIQALQATENMQGISHQAKKDLKR